MHEVTHISYGQGRVDIVLDSASQTQVAAPGFRFGDYTTLVTSCFTQKELDSIEEGENAEITFSFVVSDEVEEQLIKNLYDNAILENEAVLGNLNEGIFVDLSAKKSIFGEDTELITISDDVEIQMDIPLFLVKENRSYFFLSNKRGEYELLTDYTPDADVLTVKTHSLCPGILLYQDPLESLTPQNDDGFKLEVRHVLIAGIVGLVILWFFIDHLHKKNAN